MATERKDIFKAFAVLGLAWLDRLPTVGDAIHGAVHESLVLDLGVWRPRDAQVDTSYCPDGLSLTEALGWTLASHYATCNHCPVLRDHDRFMWVGMFDAITTAQSMMGPAETAKVAAAWLVIRRTLRPQVPWGPRDKVAEDLQRHARDASAMVSPAEVTTHIPVVATSDIGRSWSGEYGGGK